MIHQSENWAWNPAPVGVQSGDSFISCNLVQFTPETKMFEGLNDLTFIRCNCINGDYPPDTTMEECNTAQIDYEVE